MLNKKTILMCLLAVAMTNCGQKDDNKKKTGPKPSPTQTQEQSESQDLNDQTQTDPSAEESKLEPQVIVDAPVLEGNKSSEQIKVKSFVFVPSEKAAGTVGILTQDGRAVVSFDDRVKRTTRSANVAKSELVLPLENASLKLCGSTLKIEGEEAFATAKNRELVRILKAFPNDKLLVQSQVEKSGLAWAFRLNSNMVDASAKIIDVADIQGLPAQMISQSHLIACSGFCPGKQVTRKSNPKAKEKITIRQVFCDGTLVLDTDTMLTGKVQTVESQDDFTLVNPEPVGI